MTEDEPKPGSPESESHELKYPEGWRDILEASDPEAVEIQDWLNHMAEMTQQKLIDEGISSAHDKAAVFKAWQRAAEQVADSAVVEEGEEGLTEPELLDAALRT